jgi:hypothetical protein
MDPGKSGQHAPLTATGKSIERKNICEPLHADGIDKRNICCVHWIVHGLEEHAE